MKPQQRKEEGTRRYPRRDFLGTASLGIAAVVAFSVASGNSLLSPLRRRLKPPAFPKDSIFRPRKDPRLPM